MATMLDKITSFFTREDYEEDYDETEEVNESAKIEEEKSYFNIRNKSNKVVSLPQSQNPKKIVISYPTSYEQCEEICSYLKDKKSVIMNLEYVNKDVARRLLDFVSGGAYCLEGYVEKISNSIFLVAPRDFEVTNEMARDEMKNKMNIPWIKNNSNSGTNN